MGRLAGLLAPGFLINGETCPILNISGKVPSVNERLVSLQISDPKTSLQSLIKDADMKSSGDVFSGQLFMTFRVLISGTLPKSLIRGGGVNAGTICPYPGLSTDRRSSMAMRIEFSLLMK